MQNTRSNPWSQDLVQWISLLGVSRAFVLEPPSAFEATNPGVQAGIQGEDSYLSILTDGAGTGLVMSCFKAQPQTLLDSGSGQSPLLGSLSGTGSQIKSIDFCLH